MVKKVLCIVAQDCFRDEELFEPLALFKQEDIEVSIASLHRGTCRGKLGGSVEATLALDEVDVPLYDAIVCIGGPGALAFQESAAMQTLLLQAREEEKIIAAICIAPAVLASFDIMNHRYATVYPDKEALALFKEHKITYIAEDVVVDEWLITASGPQAATIFTKNIIDTLLKKGKGDTLV